MRVIQAMFLIGLLAIGFSSCQDDDGPSTENSGAVNINFNGTFAGQPLVMNGVVDLGGQNMRINVSEFYVSEIKLEGQTDEATLSDVEYVNFTESNSALSFDEVPAGTYSSLTFSIGVRSDLNAMAPEDFTSSQPLSNSATYWQGWTSYIFSKLEGKLDTSGDGETDLIFIYHSGKDDLYTPITIQFTEPLVINGETETIDLTVEHESLFEREGGYIDIEAKPTAHDANDLEYPTIILGNFRSGISME